MDALSQQIQLKSAVYEEIAAKHPVQLGKDLSMAEREVTGEVDKRSLTYGEMTFETMAWALQTIQDKYQGLPQTGTFFDLGSGTGKACLAAALCHSWDKVVGVEILEQLHASSLELVQTYNTTMPQKQAENSALFPTIPPIEMVKNDFFSVDFTQADIIYVACTKFDDETMDAIASAPVKVGAFAITVTRKLEHPNWELLEWKRMPMSWADCVIDIHRKIA